MTTIAYRDGVLAADGLCSAHGGVVSTAMIKIGGKNGIMWGATGDNAWTKKFRDWMATGMNGEISTPDDSTGGTIFLPDGNIVIFNSAGIEYRRKLPFWACGSGIDYALGAMQVGATAEEAVRAAMAWDNGTGGEVMVLTRASTHKTEEDA